MVEYIEREALMQRMGEFFSPVNTVEQALMLNYTLKMINLFPAADVAPVVHGRCDYCKDGRSFIGQTIMLANDGKCHTIHYCPNCGAKMDLKD